VIRDRVRDEAIAIAKAYSHPEVDLRHVLWGLVDVLGAATPSEVSAETVKGYLAPVGSAYQTPAVSVAAEAVLATIDSEAAAKAAVIDLAARLGPGGADAAGHGGSTSADGPVSPGAGGGGSAGPSAAGSPTGPTSATGSAATATTTTSEDRSAAPTTRVKESIEVILAELDALIGMLPVKASVRRLMAVHQLNAERRAANLPEVDASLHVVFTGNPGTGKTTIARIIGRLYGVIGLVSRGHLVEVSRADLVAGYVGQTALKVQSVVERAKGGVLFIDEAYALATEGSGEFGAEAVAMLVKLMEDHRDDLAVIVAGYPEEMRQFINSNPGLRSRFTHYIEFPDFSADELVLVFESFASTAKVRLGPGVGERVRRLFVAAIAVENFGNARYARSTFEKAYANMATRVVADGRIDRAEVEELLEADLPGDDPFIATRRPIGFHPPG
jgi:hypothetical protein